MESYAHSVDYLEKITDLDFFYQLDDSIEKKIEALEDYDSWGLAIQDETTLILVSLYIF